MAVKSCARQGLSVHPTEEEPVKIEDNIKENKEDNLKDNNVGRESASPDRQWSPPTVVESCAPPGFRFHPTEEELVGYYLKRKINSESIDFDVIPDIDLYRMEPWDLKDRCKLGYEEWNEWHFFNLKGKKYQSSTRTNRATAAGYWKTTCRDKPVVSKEKIIGMRTTLAFYKGRAPNGIKSDWYVHEYRLQTSENAPPQGDGWVLCRAFKKPTQSHRQAVQAWNHSYNVSDQHHAQLGTTANGTVSPLHHLAEGRLSPSDNHQVEIDDNLSGNRVERESAIAFERWWGSPVEVKSCVPPGFRFLPTEEELVGYYLYRKINSEGIDLDVITDVDLYRIEPWDLQDICKVGNQERNEWYFFSHNDKKYLTGKCTNRATAAGFWKTTGRDKPVLSKQKIIGMKRILVFYKGRAPRGNKSDWIMHEYRLQTSENAPPQDEGWVVCRAFKKPTRSHSETAEVGNQSQGLRHLGHQVEMNDNVTENGVGRESASAFMSIASAKKKLEEVRKEDKERNISMLSEANEENEERKHSVLCKKSDEKGWKCKREAKEGHSLCEHHLNLIRSYYPYLKCEIPKVGGCLPLAEEVRVSSSATDC